MRIHYFQHVPFEGLGIIETWAKCAGHSLAGTHFYRGQAPPTLDKVDWLIVMGGPMSVHDQPACPWLRQEKRFIEAAVGAGRRVLGICLGAQLIAEILGAKVFANPVKEIGWFPVNRTSAAAATGVGAVLPERFDAFHWHGETFELPPPAVHLAASAACVSQAFVYRERVLGLQFHLEVTKTGVEQLCKHAAREIVPGPFIEPAVGMLADQSRFTRSNELMVRVLDRVAALSE